MPFRMNRKKYILIAVLFGMLFTVSMISTAIARDKPKGAFGQLVIGDMVIPIDRETKEIQNCYATINESELYYGGVNVEGFWFSPYYRPGWSSSVSYGYHYDSGAWHCTKIAVTANDTRHTVQKRYYFEAIGDWAASSYSIAMADAREATRKKIPLRYVYDITGGTTVTKSYYGYDDTVSRVTAFDIAGANTKYAVYYGFDDPAVSQKRIWVGDDSTDYSDTGTPTGGRWIDLGIDEHNMVTKVINGCSSCGASTRSYTYVGGNTNRDIPDFSVYDSDDPGTWDPGHYLLSEVNDSSGSVLASYSYDEKDRMTSYKLGSSTKVKEWVYTDCYYVMQNHPSEAGYDPDEYSGIMKKGKNTAIYRDYVDSTNYRATEHLSDNLGSLTSSRHYHALQSGSALKGAYSETFYYNPTNSSTLVTARITTLPKGNKIYNLLGNINDDYKVTKRYRENAAGDKTLVEGEYDYTNVQGIYRMKKSINGSGGTTDYLYSSSGLTSSISPEAQASAGRFTSFYKYDGDGNVTLEISKGERTLTTAYDYDVYGNVLTQLVGYDSGDPAKGQKTIYHYNVYNEVTKTLGPEGSAGKRFYTASGALAAEVDYSDTNCNTVLRATKYDYDSNGWLDTEYVADLKSSFAGEYTGISDWIETQYLYDQYGRRTAVIADAGTGGKSLTTAYEYDNQSQVTKLTQPDGRATITERNGRGLVKSIVNQFGGNSSTANFYYDANGNLTKKVDPEDVTEVYDYDEFDRRIRTRRSN